MANSTEALIKTVLSSVVDGIAVTPRYRERQLASLHAALLTARANLTRALMEETASEKGVIDAQFLLTTQAIRSYHSSLDPRRSMEDEYRIAERKDNKSRRVPHGYAHIIPSQQDPLYSTLVPVAAAIAAGNCVVVQMQQDLSSTHQALEKLLLACLSSQTTVIVESDPAIDMEFKQRYCIELDAREVEGGTTTLKKLCTNANRVAGIVDRSGDIAMAAKECVKARLGFGGRSTYAPDIVLVNEFCVPEFCSVATQMASQYISNAATRRTGSNGKATPSKSQQGISIDVREQLEKSSAEILITGDRGTVALMKSRDNAVLSQKLRTPLLLVVPTTSMDDAINSLGQEKLPLRAAYIFGAPAAAKYLGQFISSSLSTINHIPNELLIGPPAPTGHPMSIQPRYTTEMFSIAQPEVIQVSSLSDDLSTLTSEQSTVKEKQKIDEGLAAKLVRVSEPFGPPVGFFEQGILFGLACLLLTVGTVGAFTIKYSAPAVLARLRGT